MANPKHIEKFAKGVKKWNKWRKRNPALLPDLEGMKIIEVWRLAGKVLSNWKNANFSKTGFYQADLSGISLNNSNFAESGLAYSTFFSSSLEQTDFTKTELDGASFRGARLTGANFDGATLYDTDFSEADLTGTNFAGSILSRTIFGACDLRDAIGLNHAIHTGPSYIGIDTIYRSKGQIPHKFLRDAGVPENFITYMSSLTGKAFEYFSAFISYTEADDTFSKRLYEGLQTAGLRVWRWREDAKWGAPIEKNIDQAVRIYDKLIVICSEDSLKAPAVIDEIDRALQKEHQLMKEGKTPEVLFPITIDDYIFEEWEHYLKPKVMAKTVGDFRGWEDPKKYDSALERLISALRQE